MRRRAHAQRHGGATAGAFAVAGGGDLFDQPGLDQLGADGGDGGGRDVQFARKGDAGDEPGGADAFKDLLAQRALGFCQGWNQRTDALWAICRSSPTSCKHHYFSPQRKQTQSHSLFAISTLRRGETGSNLL